MLPAAAAKPRMRDATPGEGAKCPKGWSPCTQAPQELPLNPAEQHRIQTPTLTHCSFTDALSHLPSSFYLPSGPSPLRHTLPSTLSPPSFPPSLGFSAVWEAVGEEICLYSGKKRVTDLCPPWRCNSCSGIAPGACVALWCPLPAQVSHPTPTAKRVTPTCSSIAEDPSSAWRTSCLPPTLCCALIFSS